MPKKEAIVLLDDFWHPRHTIEPALEALLPSDEFFVKVIWDPTYLTALQRAPDLIINFKDGIANTQIPTRNWYDGMLDFLLPMLVEMGGCGYLGVHCGLANIPEEHAAFKKLLKGRFLNHPPQCPVTFTPTAAHPITNGVEPFTVTDEHYFVDVTEAETQVLGRTSSTHGDNIALWAHECGNGRVCGVTPGHSTQVLTHPGYQRLLRNAVLWCTKQI